MCPILSTHEIQKWTLTFISINKDISENQFYSSKWSHSFFFHLCLIYSCHGILASLTPEPPRLILAINIQIKQWSHHLMILFSRLVIISPFCELQFSTVLIFTPLAIVLYACKFIPATVLTGHSQSRGKSKSRTGPWHTSRTKSLKMFYKLGNMQLSVNLPASTCGQHT